MSGCYITAVVVVAAVVLLSLSTSTPGLSGQLGTAQTSQNTLVVGVTAWSELTLEGIWSVTVTLPVNNLAE